MTAGFTNLLNSYPALPAYALSQPSDTAVGVLGQIYNVTTPEVTSNVTQVMYVRAHADLTVGTPYLAIPGLTDSEWVTIAIPGADMTNATIVVPQFAVASGQYAYMAVIGEITASVTGTVVAGDFLSVVESTTAFAPNGSSGATTYDSNVCGRVVVGRTGAGTTTIRLCGGFLTSPIKAAP